MNLRPEQYLTALAIAQAGEVAPALEGTYFGGTAGTIAAVLIMAVQDVASLAAREAAEAGRLRAILDRGSTLGLTTPYSDSLGSMRSAIIDLHAALEKRSDVAAKALVLSILDHYVETADAALLVAPSMP